jgi:hypothetical protein
MTVNDFAGLEFLKCGLTAGNLLSCDCYGPGRNMDRRWQQWLVIA